MNWCVAINFQDRDYLFKINIQETLKETLKFAVRNIQDDEVLPKISHTQIKACLQ